MYVIDIALDFTIRIRNISSLFNLKDHAFTSIYVENGIKINLTKTSLKLIRNEILWLID